MQVRPYLIDTSYIPEKVKPWIRSQNQLIVMGVDPMADKPNPIRVDTQADPTSHGGQKKSTVGGLKIIFLDVSYFKSELMGSLSIPEPDISPPAASSCRKISSSGISTVGRTSP